MQTWQLQEAKAHLSEVVKLCTSQGPQLLTVRGKEEAVILSKKDYEKLTGKSVSFLKMMTSSPLKGLDMEFERDHSKNREINL
ncbi:MAG: type II toxin-antitoxin system Phd/YefM family antitoxin [Alphaproteobacteria bacterium]|jgi:prevent-host-death family protein